MREVDEALTHAYAQRSAASPAQSVPPSPHWLGRTAGPHKPPGMIAQPALPGRTAETDPEAASVLAWPGIVLVLEQRLGPALRGDGGTAAGSATGST